MITLPVGFNVTGLVNEFFAIGAALAGLASLVAVGFLVLRIIKKA